MRCPLDCFRPSSGENDESNEELSAEALPENSKGSRSEKSSIDKPSYFINPSRSGYYRYTFLAIWIFITVVIVLDRFFTNFWPRQSFSGPPCDAKCGNDFFCGPGGEEGPIGCLRKGPWSAKIFDILARASARLIISTTNLMFLTVSHTTWNYLSETSLLKPYLYNWREDNMWLHIVGGWTLGVWTLAHMYSLLLPSIFHGFKNVQTTGEFGWPAQIPLGTSQINSEIKEARWGSDDIWRIVWLSLIFCILFPYSRSSWGLRKNFSLAMWVHVGSAAGFFIDSFRRRTHPHVWILNSPFVLWYIADRVASLWFYRADRRAVARRIVLDKNYMLLLWKQNKFEKRICDLYWLRERFPGKRRRASEWSHPFTVASAHYVKFQDDGSTSSQETHKSMIEVPVSTDTHWDGHRFSLKVQKSDSNHDESFKVFRLGTHEFREKRIGNDSNDHSTSWDCMAIMRVQRREDGKNTPSAPKWFVGLRGKLCGLFFRSPETQNIAEKDLENNPGGSVCVRAYGPYRSSYGRLTELPHLPPLIVIGTGAGAALVLDVVAHIREHNIELQYPIQLYYSASSLPLLQFVTNNVLAVKIPGLTVCTALTRNEDLEFEEPEDDEKKGQFQLERFSVKDIISQAVRAPKTEVYFCGAGKINERLRKECSKLSLKYVGSSVS